AIAPRANTTNLASSSDSSVIGSVPVFGVVSVLRFHGADQHRTDPYPAAVVRSALGPQPQPVPGHLGAGQRHPAELQRDQPTDGVHVEITVEFASVQFAEI